MHTTPGLPSWTDIGVLCTTRDALVTPRRHGVGLYRPINLGSTSIPAQHLGPDALPMTDMGSTTELAPGAGVDALCSI